jgi:hypothetical protein
MLFAVTNVRAESLAAVSRILVWIRGNLHTMQKIRRSSDCITDGAVGFGRVKLVDLELWRMPFGCS